MTVKQLKEAINDLPDNMDVFMGERFTEFDYGLANSATVEDITLYDEFNNERNAPVRVLVIKED